MADRNPSAALAGTRFQCVGRGHRSAGFGSAAGAGLVRLWVAAALTTASGCADDRVPPSSTGSETGAQTGSDSTDEGSSSAVSADESTTGPGDSGSTGSTGGPSEGTTTGSGGATTSTDGSSTASGDSDGSSSGGIFVCDPIDLGSALGDVYVGTTEGASDDLPIGCLKYDGPEVELLWTAPLTGSFQIDTLAAEFDTALQIHRSDCDGEVAACNDDFFGLQSAMLLDLVEGEAIVVLVDGYGGATGDFTLSIVEAQAGDCCEPGFFGGCADNGCEALVCAVDPTCCSDQWDSACADTLAPTLCAACAPPGSCCFPQPDAGCTDASCEADVCAIDASCCSTQWTQACADLAETTCQSCMPLDCCSAHLGPGCGTPSCQNIVCTQWDQWCCDVEWDAWCAQLANDNCPTCQEPGPCCAANPGIGCDIPAVETCVCDDMPECCNAQWTGACVNAVTSLGCGMCAPLDLSCVDVDLGSSLGEVASGTNLAAGNDTTISCTAAGGQETVYSWIAPASDTYVFDTVGSNYDTALAVRFPDCVGPELACTGFLGDFNSQIVLDLVDGQPVVVVLDGYGAATGDYVLNINPVPGFGFCCGANGSPGCSSAPCEAAVCATDPSCCSADWGPACAAAAQIECAVCQGLGDCCTAHPDPGCSDFDCATAVCNFDPFCCDTEWADFCVNDTSFACAGLCD